MSQTQRPAASTSTPQIIALGEAMVEFNQTGEGDGRLYLQGFGGDTSNFAIAAARQGASAGCIGALGDDANGRALRALWDREGVDHRGVDPAPHPGPRRPAHPPHGLCGRVLALRPALGHRGPP